MLFLPIKNSGIILGKVLPLLAFVSLDFLFVCLIETRSCYAALAVLEPLPQSSWVPGVGAPVASVYLACLYLPLPLQQKLLAKTAMAFKWKKRTCWTTKICGRILQFKEIMKQWDFWVRWNLVLKQRLRPMKESKSFSDICKPRALHAHIHTETRVHTTLRKWSSKSKRSIFSISSWDSASLCLHIFHMKLFQHHFL